MNPDRPTNRACGFRMSWIDAVILLLGTVLTWWLMTQSFPLWWIVPAALGHFFLFCNVFLVWQRWELLWAASFVFNVAAHLALGAWDWPSPIMFQLPITALVIVLADSLAMVSRRFCRTVESSAQGLPHRCLVKLKSPRPALDKNRRCKARA